MLVLGLDPSLTSFGWALHDTAATGPDRCPDRGRFRTNAQQLFIRRYIYMRTCITELVSRHRPDKVAIEYPIFNDLWSEGLYGLFLYSCEALLDTGSDVVFFANNQTKAKARRMLGRPSGWKVAKLDMIEAARKDSGGRGWSSDEADAYIAALLGGRFWELWDGSISEEDLTTYERRVFTQIKRPLRGRHAGKTLLKGIIHREDERFFLWSQVEEEEDGDGKV